MSHSEEEEKGFNYSFIKETADIEASK